MLTPKTVEQLFIIDLTPLKIKILKSTIQDVVRKYIAHEKSDYEKKLSTNELLERIIVFLEIIIRDKLDKISQHHLSHAEFKKYISGSTTEIEKKEHILSFAKDLGATPKQILLDKKAFSRWFGEDTVTDRYHTQIAVLESDIAFYLERLGTLGKHYIQNEKESLQADLRNIFKKIQISKIIMPLIAYQGDNRVRLSAFQCISNLLFHLPQEIQKESVDEKTIQYIYRAALDKKQPIWIQCEALKLLESMSLNNLKKALEQRLSIPGDKDDLFVRSCAVKVLADNLKVLEEFHHLFDSIIKDPSPFVRQAMIDALLHAQTDDIQKYLWKLAIEDQDSKVRAYAILKIQSFASQTDLFEFLLKLLRRVLASENDTYTLRVSLNVCVSVLKELVEAGLDEQSKTWYQYTVSQLTLLNTTHSDLSIRRWAAQAREQMWSEFHQDIKSLKIELKKIIDHIKPGKKKYVSRKLIKNHDKHVIGRLLAVICQDDFPLTIKNGFMKPCLYRGFHFGFRLWRFLFEFKNPSPDKRQAFKHTIGRLFYGNMHCHSQILYELSSTKVPGEPLLMPGESGWRPYLPLVDEMLSVIDNAGFWNQPTMIYTSEGMTAIYPPKWWITKMWARYKLTLNFYTYAGMRNWEESSQELPYSYVQSLKKLGFKIDYTPYSIDSDGFEVKADPMVSRFFQISSDKEENV
jgi:hypothetical protein